MANVTIGCKLPHGLVLENPLKPSEKVKIAGLNKSLIIGADHVTTTVDKEFWDTWKATNPNFAALKSGAIFEAKDTASAKAIAKEKAKEKTGFEPMDPNDKKSGVTKATEE